MNKVEFLLKRVPEAKHKKIISEVDQGFRYTALREACRSGNTQVVDRLLKAFSQEEIDRIFLPTSEETKNLPLPSPYNNILLYDSVKINQHILTKVSPDCREKIVTSEIYVHSLAQAYGNQDEKRSLGLLKQVPRQQLVLVRQSVGLEIDKQGQKVIKQKFENDCSFDINVDFKKLIA